MKLLATTKLVLMLIPSLAHCARFLQNHHVFIVKLLKSPVVCAGAWGEAYELNAPHAVNAAKALPCAKMFYIILSGVFETRPARTAGYVNVNNSKAQLKFLL